jgi:hypothetical protein
MREIHTRVGIDAPETQLAAILKLDFTNMFNSTSRELIREELDQHFPDLLYLFDLLYPLEGNRVYFTHPDGTGDSFRQRERESQGCPLSTFFLAFCFTNFSLLSLLRSLLALNTMAPLTSFLTLWLSLTTLMLRRPFRTWPLFSLTCVIMAPYWDSSVIPNATYFILPLAPPSFTAFLQPFNET